MNKTYKVTSSENYEFFYIRNSLAEKDIESIIKIQENCFNVICSTLRILPDFKIKYYLINTPEEIGQIYGDNEPCNGFASLPDTIFAVYNDKTKCIGFHEDVHVLSNIINKPKSVFIREGLAMYFDKIWWGIENEKWVKRFITNHKYISITQLIQDEKFYTYLEEFTYPIAGSFTKFLIEKFGMNLYIDFYKHNLKYSEEYIENHFQKPIVELEKAFIQWIESLN